MPACLCISGDSDGWTNQSWLDTRINLTVALKEFTTLGLLTGACASCPFRFSVPEIRASEQCDVQLGRLFWTRDLLIIAASALCLAAQYKPLRTLGIEKQIISFQCLCILSILKLLLLLVWSSDIWSSIGENISRWDQSHINTRHEILDWFGPSRRVIFLRLVLMYYAIEIDSSLFLLVYFGVFRGFLPDSFWGFSGCPRCESIISIYSRETVS
jgi:hypothetical protein